MRDQRRSEPVEIRASERRLLDRLCQIAGDPPRPITSGQKALAIQLDVSLPTLERLIARLRAAGLASFDRGGGGRPGVLRLSAATAHVARGERRRAALEAMSTLGETQALATARILAQRGHDDDDLANAGRQYLDIASEEERARIIELGESLSTAELGEATFRP